MSQNHCRPFARSNSDTEWEDHEAYHPIELLHILLLAKIGHRWFKALVVQTRQLQSAPLGKTGRCPGMLNIWEKIIQLMSNSRQLQLNIHSSNILIGKPER